MVNRPDGKWRKKYHPLLQNISNFEQTIKKKKIATK